jgi:hypothetical protein
MKTFIIRIAVLVASCSPLVAHACDHIAMGTRSADGTEVSLVISEEDISSTTPWNPEDGEPPLGLSNAYALAMLWAKPHYAAYDDVEIHRAVLAKFRCRSGGATRLTDHWYYVFDLALVRDGRLTLEVGHWIAVLMDGRVVTPTRSR